MQAVVVEKRRVFVGCVCGWSACRWKARCQPMCQGLTVGFAAAHGDPRPGLSAFETLADDSTWRAWEVEVAAQNDPMNCGA